MGNPYSRLNTLQENTPENGSMGAIQVFGLGI